MHSVPSSLRCPPLPKNRCERHQKPALNLRHGCHHPQTGQCAMAKKTIDERKMLVIMGGYPAALHVRYSVSTTRGRSHGTEHSCQELPEKPTPGLVDDILQEAVRSGDQHGLAPEGFCRRNASTTAEPSQYTSKLGKEITESTMSARRKSSLSPCCACA